MSLVLAVIKQESRFRPQMKGGKGEYGLMQIMPAVATDWTKANKREAFRSLDILFQPEQNLDVGCWHLARAVRRWRDAGYRDWVSLALAQYNAGATRVIEQGWAPPDKAANGKASAPMSKKFEPINSITNEKGPVPESAGTSLFQGSRNQVM